MGTTTRLILLTFSSITLDLFILKKIKQFLGGLRGRTTPIQSIFALGVRC